MCFVSIHVTPYKTRFEYQYVPYLHAWRCMKSGLGSSSLQTHLGLCDVAVWLLCGLDRWGRRTLSGGSEQREGFIPHLLL